MPLRSVLSDDVELDSSEAAVRFVSTVRYVWSRVALHAPFVVPGIVGMALLLARSASRNQLGWTIAAFAIVGPFLIAYLVHEARQTVTSKGSQLCLVALPKGAIRFLGVTGSHVLQDGAGLVPRYPLVASGNGLVLGPPRRDGGGVGTLRLRESDICVELESTSRGRLAGCTLSRDDERIRLAVRGRLRLKHS